MYYRYEIVDNTGKKYGFLSGLKEIGFNYKEEDELTEFFNKYLPVPDFYYKKGKNAKRDVYAYFTEYGIEIFRKYIEEIISKVKEKGFNVIVKEQTPVGTKRLIYYDKYQVLIKDK